MSLSKMEMKVIGVQVVLLCYKWLLLLHSIYCFTLQFRKQALFSSYSSQPYVCMYYKIEFWTQLEAYMVNAFLKLYYQIIIGLS